MSLVANAAIGMPLPDPLSPEWWVTRTLWLGIAGAAVVPVALLFGRFERARRAPREGSAAAAARPGWTALDAVCGVAGVSVLLVVGFAPIPAGVALELLLVALVGGRRIDTVIGSVAMPPSHPIGVSER